MKNFWLLLLFTSLMYSCGGGSENDPVPNKPNNPEPEKPVITYSAEIILNDTIFLNQTTSFSLKTNNSFDKVEYYIDGQQIGTSISNNYSLAWEPKGILAGEHAIEALCYVSDKTHKFKSNNFLKIKIGDKYAGGIVIDVYDNYINGLVAAESDLFNQKDDDYRFRWGKNGTLIGANDKDGKVNTDLIIQKMSDEKYTFANFLKDGIEIDGYKDWYIPSKEEAEKVSKDIVPNLNLEKYYWTSTETDAERAVFRHYRGSLMGTNQTKNYLYHIRLIRKF